MNSPTQETLEHTIPAPEASRVLEEKISLTWETKRLISEIEKEVEALDWGVTDPLQAVPAISQPALHLLAAGGKRVRPLLVALLGRSLGVPFEK